MAMWPSKSPLRKIEAITSPGRRRSLSDERAAAFARLVQLWHVGRTRTQPAWRGVTHHEGVIGDVLRDDAARRDHGPLADGHAAHDGGVRAGAAPAFTSVG